MSSAHWRQTGAIWPAGVSCSLTWYDVGAILTLIQSHRVRTVLEIGVEHGGMAALFLALCRVTPLAYLGIDIHLTALATPLAAHERYVFWERDAWQPEAVDAAGAWLMQHDGPRLIFIDGGDKPKELRLYAPLLTPGDLIVAHDYHNEYGDEALADLPPRLRRVGSDWLDDTLLCAFRREDA